MRHFAVLATTLAASTALAHGGAPLAESLAFVHGKPHLVTTYGVMFQDDAGKWLLACEEAVSPGPKRFSLFADGTVGLGHASGYATTHDYCDYDSTPLQEAVEQIVRVRPPGDVGDDAVVLFLAVTQTGRNLRISTDRGATFTALAVPAGMHPNAVIDDASVPGRLWVSAQDRAHGGFALLRSDDLGGTWTTTAFALEAGKVPRVASAGPAGLFVRVSQVDEARVLRSDDLGETFDEVLSTTAVYYSFVKDLGNGEVWTAETNGGTLRSRDSGVTWSRVDLSGVTCLERTEGRLWACVIDIPGNRGLVTSDDDGATWAPLFRYSDVTAMLGCAEDTEGSVCEDYWLISAVGMKVPTAATPDAGEVPVDPQPCCASAGGPGLLAGPLLLALLARRRQRSLSR